MAFYQSTFSIAGVNTTNQVLANLKTAATDRAIIREIGVFVEVAPTSAPQYGLMRMNAVGTGAITVATPLLSDPADGAASVGLETAWATTRPTVTGGVGRRALVPATIGNGYVWDFTNRGLIVPVSSGLCIVIANASGATVGQHGGYVVWEE
jgi:hypothetical protein